MIKYLFIALSLFALGCAEKLEKLDDSKRNYDSLEKTDCDYQSNDIFILNNQSFESISESINLFNDSILGVEWAKEIEYAVNDSIKRCLFLKESDYLKRKLFKLDSTELFNLNDSPKELIYSRNKLLLNGGDSYTYFQYKDYSVSMTFKICFDKVDSYRGRVYDAIEIDDNICESRYRNSYETQLKLIIDYVIKPPSTIISSQKNEECRLEISDYCTLLRQELGDKLKNTVNTM